jgi:hypothetical protein
MVNTLSKSQLEDLSLKPSFQEIFDSKTQNVIELHFVLLKYSNSDQPTEQGITYSKNKEYTLIVCKTQDQEWNQNIYQTVYCL